MDSERAAALLASERQRIEAALSDLGPGDHGEELSHADQHPADDGTDLYEEERDAGLADALRGELAAVERAEQRLAEGKYGLSVESGEPIPDARLEVQPSAERTVEEQARYEGAG